MTKNSPKTFIIHLHAAVARQTQVEYIKQNSLYPVEIIDAIDGDKLSQEEINQYYPPKSTLKPKYPFGLNSGEIGCFLSHRKAWKAIVDQNLKAGFIIEDDIDFDRDVLQKILELSAEHIENLGYIQVPARSPRGDSSSVVDQQNITLDRFTVIPLGACGQLVGYETAKKLLELTGTIDRPVDTFLQMHWFTGIYLVTATPVVLTEISYALGGSTLSKKRALREKIKRVIQRFWYRMQVKFYSSQ